VLLATKEISSKDFLSFS